MEQRHLNAISKLQVAIEDILKPTKIDEEVNSPYPKINNNNIIY